ncbi:MAG: L-seryl-tRNA(Sec) selenium transferase [Proteobacteria bacterium]|nr:L-seryl-tRNA(Sec) selenium transferase [Pseudomonadota bacterium]MBU1713493.1 L-seryl-tRNA(Sec) selenium transferase [Pseudomonadota bacterium]
MELNEKQQTLLRMLPGIDHILELSKAEPSFEYVPKSVLVQSARRVVENFRAAILDENKSIEEKDLADLSVFEKIKETVKKAMTPNLMRTINATGVVVHTNLGRSVLASCAAENLLAIATGYSNLEFDLSKGERGSRYSCVAELLCEISGAEAAMVVNNNAGAVLLCLETIARNRKVIVSRGELVEIGGSFRIPDVMAKSGSILKEVGTTNRTHLKDYMAAIDNDTGLLLKVHASNYCVVGFTASVTLKELVELGSKYRIPVMEDLGSGTFIDFSKYGLSKEPTVQESVSAGADVVTFSGDKLLGGPQAGIIVGKKDVLDSIKKNPITRALRIDKLTLAALESTLRLYRNPEKAVHLIPTLRMLTIPIELIKKRADKLYKLLSKINNPALSITLADRCSKAGGGSLPLLDLPSRCIAVKIEGVSANSLERKMRENMPPVIGRIEDDYFLMDLRTVQEEELSAIKNALNNVLNRNQ